jgi:hypothetical protein
MSVIIVIYLAMLFVHFHWEMRVMMTPGMKLSAKNIIFKPNHLNHQQHEDDIEWYYKRLNHQFSWFKHLDEENQLVLLNRCYKSGWKNIPAAQVLNPINS